MKTKHVIGITGIDTLNTDKMDTVLLEVPHDYIRCSVCGSWEPQDSFRKEGEERQSRTNCKVCYEMDYEKMLETKEAYQKFIKLPKHYNKAHKLLRTHELNNQYNSLFSVNELIEELKKLDQSKKIAMKIGSSFYNVINYFDFKEESVLMKEKTVYVLMEINENDE